MAKMSGKWHSVLRLNKVSVYMVEEVEGDDWHSGGSIN